MSPLTPNQIQADHLRDRGDLSLADALGRLLRFTHALTTADHEAPSKAGADLYDLYAAEAAFARASSSEKFGSGGAVGEREEPQIHHGNAKRMLRKLYPRLPQTEAGLAMAEEWAAGTGLLNDQRGSVPERILQIEQQAAGEALRALRWLADDVSAEDVSALDLRVWESLGVARHVLARLSVNEGPVARTEAEPHE